MVPANPAVEVEDVDIVAAAAVVTRGWIPLFDTEL